MNPASRPRALVVDSDPAMLAFAAEALNAFRPGFDVATARDLEQARCWIGAFHPDLLLIGLEHWQEALENLSGLLAQTSQGASCKILLCIPEGAVGPSQPEIEVVPRTIVGKPLDLGELLTVVRELV